MLPKRSNEVLQKALNDFRALRESEAISDDLYFKCMISLAFELTENQEYELAFRLLFECPPIYYETVAPLQAKDDLQFRDHVLRMTHTFIQAGYVVEDTTSSHVSAPTARA